MGPRGRRGSATSRDGRFPAPTRPGPRCPGQLGQGIPPARPTDLRAAVVSQPGFEGWNPPPDTGALMRPAVQVPLPTAVQASRAPLTIRPRGLAGGTTRSSSPWPLGLCPPSTVSPG